MRLFVAAEIPPAVRDAIAALIDEMRRELPGLKWVRPESIHVTLRFLGEVNEADLPRLTGALRPGIAGAAGPFDVAVAGAGVFPDRGRPRVLWVGLREETGKLVTLQSAVGRTIDGLGLPGVRRDDRPFRPHLTVARMGEGRPPARLGEALERRRDAALGRFTVASLWLYRSLLKPAGAEYQRIEEYPL